MNVQRRITIAGMFAIGAIAVVPVAPSGTGTVTVSVHVGQSDTPLAGGNVTVLGSSIAAMTDAFGHAVLSNVPAGARTVAVSKSGKCSATRAINVPAGKTVAIAMWMCTDAVETPSTPGENLIALLDVNIGTTGPQPAERCLNDLLLQGTGGVNLRANALPIGACHGALTLLSAEHGLAFVKDPATLSWTGSTTDVISIALPAAKLRVPIAFMVVGWTQAIQDWLDQVQLPDAKLILHDSFSGIELAGNMSGGPIAAPMHASATQAKTIGDGCATASLIKTNPALYNRERINVYVVPQIGPAGGGSKAGEDCAAYGSPEIIFVDAKGGKPFTLIHEIGHALGLVRPEWGHTIGLTGFYQSADDQPLNIMAGTEELESRYLSVGQVVRMTMAPESWLNMPLADGTTMRGRQASGSGLPVVAPCGCPEKDARADCPALATDIARPFSPQAVSTDVMACNVGVPASVKVVCPATTSVAADFLQGTTAAVGNGLWVSLTPSIVTAESSPTTTRQGILTGHAKGVGRVRVWVDGSFADIAVQVSGSCT